jgi:hypothetical protein
MVRRAKDGSVLNALVRQACSFCQQAQRQMVRKGPGRKPQIPDWVLAVMIMVAILRGKKTKSAQFTFWRHRRREFHHWMPGQRLPGRSTFFDRYRRVHPLFELAIRLQGLYAIERGWADPVCLAVDKSLIAGRGPAWSSRERRNGHRPKGVDSDTTWGYSKHDGWVQGYSFEVVVTAPKNGVVWPLLASVDIASRSEQKSVLAKVARLPAATRFVLADAGYDSNVVAESVEWQGGRRTGRRFLCPAVPRPNDRKTRKPESRQSRERQEHRRLRDDRRAFFRKPPSRRMYARRKQTVEPFHAHLKHLFDLEKTVWHRGLANNQTMILAAISAYQGLLMYNHKQGRSTAQIQRILDVL